MMTKVTDDVAARARTTVRIPTCSTALAGTHGKLMLLLGDDR